MSSCHAAPWWRFGRHKWIYSVVDGYRAQQDAEDRWLMGTHMARELRTCRHCSRQETREVYAGPYIPFDWTLKGYEARFRP